MFIINIPDLFKTWQTSYETLRFNIDSMERLKAVDPLVECFSILSYPGYFTENLPGIILLLALFTIVFPGIRSWVIELRNNLVQPPPSFKTLAEIKYFIEEYAPGLQMKINLKRPGLIWIYPNGYRKATLAVFSGFIMLWKTNREQAEAILQHELTHYRRGDALFLGPGSFLESAIKLTLLFYTFFVAMPYIITSIDYKIQLSKSLQKIEAMATESYILAIAKQIFLSVLGLLATTVAFLVKALSSFVLPVSCIWAAELNADYLVTRNPKHKTALLYALSRPWGKVSWWRRMLFKLSHPPNSLRRFYARHSDSYYFLFLLLIFPLAIFVRIAILHIWFFFFQGSLSVVSALAGRTTELTWPEFWQSFVENTRVALTSQSLNWLLMTGLLIVWVFIVHSWERFFTGDNKQLSSETNYISNSSQAGLIRVSHQSQLKYFILAAVFTVTIFFLAIMWRI
jgi:hypothetical protein